MFKNKPVTLLIAAGLMIILIAVTGILPLFSSSMGTGGPEGNRGNFDPNNMPNGGTRPDGQTMGTPPADGNMPSGNPPSDGDMPSMPQNGDGSNFNPGDGSNMPGSGSSSSMNMKVMQLLRGLQVGGGILVVVIGIASIVGIILSKKWGQILAIVASVLSLVIIIPSLFQRMTGLTLIETLVTIAVAVAIMVLCFLPRSRKAVVSA